MNHNPDNPNTTVRGTTNYLDLPKAEFEQLNTDAAYAKFNGKRRPSDQPRDREGRAAPD